MALEDFDTHDSTESQAARPAPAPVQKQPTAFLSRPATGFVPAPAKKATSPEDEDLFDFPVVEMKFEAAVGKRPGAPLAPAPVPAAAPTAPRPVAPAAKSATPAKEPAKEAAKAAVVEVRPQDKKDVAQAAQLVEDIEQVLVSDGAPRERGQRVKGPSPLALAGIAALVLTNLLGLFFLWGTARSYQSGVQAMNEKLAETLRQQSESQGQAGLAAGQGSARAAHAEGSPARTSTPLEAFELVSLRMAREEIGAGEYADARRRLSRLLAVADRIDAEAREDIEAQASFLIASTYRKQAEALREKSP